MFYKNTDIEEMKLNHGKIVVERGHFTWFIISITNYKNLIDIFFGLLSQFYL